METIADVSSVKPWAETLTLRSKRQLLFFLSALLPNMWHDIGFFQFRAWYITLAESDQYEFLMNFLHVSTYEPEVTVREGRPILRIRTPRLREATPRLGKGQTQVSTRNTEVAKSNTEVTKKNTEVTEFAKRLHRDYEEEQ